LKKKFSLKGVSIILIIFYFFYRRLYRILAITNENMISSDPG